MTRYVVIGNGVAGVSALETIRRYDPDGSIALIASEKFPPYSRPMISLVLEGSVAHERLAMRGPDFYERLRIEPVIGEKAASIDVRNKTVVTDSDKKIPYDKLLIASGSHARTIKAENSGLPRIFPMRTEADVRGMVEALPEVKDALVLGGGLVGYKAAYGLLHRGVKTTMLISSGYPLSMQVDEPAGRIVLEELLERGLCVRTGIDVTAFEGNGAVRQAHLSDGSTADCQLAVIGKGVWPSHQFVPKEDILTDLGIRVDEYFQTSAPGVYAAGDVAEAFDAVRQTPWVNAIWPVAVEQGRLAGMNMAGIRAPYSGSMGRNVIRAFGVDVLTGGLVNPPGGNGYEIFLRHEPDRKYYRKLVVKDGLLCGLVMVGRIEQGGILLSMIQNRRKIDFEPERMLDPNFNFGRIYPF